MKKGFTLAEVLITLSIIGVVAAVTIPQLNVNVKERAAIAGYKKAINMLSNIGTVTAAAEDFDYSDAAMAEKTASADMRGNDSSGHLRHTLYAMLVKYGKVDVAKTENPPSSSGNSGSEHNSIANSLAAAATSGVIYFRDGSSLITSGATMYAMDADVSSAIIQCTYDTNGDGAPNEMSTCGDVNCSQGKNIKDRFIVTLYGEDAYPGKCTVSDDICASDNSTQDYAARWAFATK